MKVKSESEVAQSCLTLHNPMDYSLPGSSIHGIFQARVLEWGAIAFSDIVYSIGIQCIYYDDDALNNKFLESLLCPRSCSLGSEDNTVNITDRNPCLHGAFVSVGR